MASLTSVDVETTLHAQNFWILVPITLGPDTELQFVLDSGSALSLISPALEEQLISRGIVSVARNGWYQLRNPSIQNQPIPDFRVRVSPRLADRGADALLGLQFLLNYRDIHFNVPSLRLTLTP